MEKAILKTLIYADIFDYPLKINEIHKWLIGRKVSLRQVEKGLEKLVQSSKCKVQSGGYFLPKKVGTVANRARRENQSEKYYKKAQLLAGLLKVIPWVKLVGVSGGLALSNATQKDDIDLFIITAKKRLWLSRIFCLGLLSLTGQRRKAGEKGRKIAGKLCINTLLEDSSLEQKSKDIYVAHEVLQMKVLWQRDGIYQKYLEDNSWAFKFLPNWISTTLLNPRDIRDTPQPRDTLLDIVERLAKWIQLKIMQKPQGLERVEERALYFHPNDCRLKILAEYKAGIKKL